MKNDTANNGKGYVLDTSALLTLIEDEDGADRVEKALKEGKIIISWMSLLEVLYISLQETGEEVAMQRYAMLKELDAEIAWEMDEPLLIAAARLKASRRLSLADAIIAALAIQRNAILLHKDPEYQALHGMARLEALPYKTHS